ncbi:MAG: metallophosphoesterase family protein [bacterium]|nr:MAG: metallophosphoesterase family protein [bacterium]
MRYLVFSDIHGNVEALYRVLEELEVLRPDIVVSLGDVVGYGANPGDCIEIVQTHTHIRIGGNHDLAAVGLTSSDDFNGTAKRAITWTSRNLNPTHRDMLEGYDTIRRHGDCLFTHASPISPMDWEYVYTVPQAKEIFENFSEKFIFIGHTHVPGIITYRERDGCAVASSQTLQIEHGTRYLINVGSIGQPRDGIAAASFALVDLKKGKISIRRAPYDIVSAQQKIRSAGLPESLALRLATAR